MDQQNLTVFDFGEAPVRVLMMEEAPWFVLADVCHVLEIGNSRDAASRLDSDEKSSVGISDGSQVRHLNIVNESGLYNLIFRSRKASARKFRKWVTSKVLPEIRQTGRYEMVATPDVPEPMDRYDSPMDIPSGELSARVNLVSESRRTFGPRAAQEVWKRIGFPDMAGLSLSGPDDDPDGDPTGCIAHLMRHRADRISVARTVEHALNSKSLAAAMPVRFGLRIVGDDADAMLLIAHRHPFLDQVFGYTQWAKEWRRALAGIPGAAVTSSAFDEARSATSVPFRALRSMGVFKTHYGPKQKRSCSRVFE